MKRIFPQAEAGELWIFKTGEMKMSCTIFALPYALVFIGSMIARSAINTAADNIDEGLYKHRLAALKQSADINSKDCEDIRVISEKNFIEQDFETPFTDKALLIKTLKEHGVNNISEHGTEKISCTVENYKLIFTKTGNETPYYLHIRCLETDNAEEKLNDISSEYALNVQEEVYLNIIEKLKNNDMTIENEEVTEDNTIVLTVNID